MTHSEAWELGRRAAAEHLEEAMGPVFSGTIGGIVQDLEDSACDAAPIGVDVQEKKAFIASFLRGASAHARDLMLELDARAAVVEATR
jgi:hypothetical protein